MDAPPQEHNRARPARILVAGSGADVVPPVVTVGMPVLIGAPPAAGERVESLANGPLLKGWRN
jgi:hypothetical protein